MKSVLAAVLALSAAAPAAAQEIDPGELEALQESIEARRAESERLAAEAAEKAEEAALLKSEVIAAANALTAQEAAVAEVEARLQGILSQEKDAERDLAARRAAYSDVLSALQALEMSRPPAIAVRPDDAAEAARIGLLLAEAAPVLAERAEALKLALDRLRALEKAARAEQEALQTAQVELSSRRDALDALLQRKVAERDAASRLAEETQAEISRLAARASTLSELVERLERVKRAVTPRVKPTAREPRTVDVSPRRKPAPLAAFTPETRFVDARGRLPTPVSGRLVARFGERRDAGGGRYEGVVFRTAPGALVTAPFSGSVVFARDWTTVGNVLILDVGGGYHLIVIGVGSFMAREGATVDAGEPLGAMAGGGSASDLYLEIRKNSEPVDPAGWLSRI
ncbi:MAG: peptidoglycan DD-metalloendopeptidase family protein [Pseudomonadota bacterium]